MLSKRRLIFCGLMAAVMLYTVPVNAEDKDAQLPVITSWQDGHGYREDGTQILDGWAYDSVNPAGKYVLFGADGSVLRKAESQKKTDPSEDYTGTELVSAVIALRAEVFEGFHGTVKVRLREKGGVQKSVELNTGNFFGLNICVNSGDYSFQEVEAKDGENVYAAEFSDAAVRLPEKGVRVMKICVTETKMELQETSEHAEPETKGEETGQHTQQKENKQGKEEGIVRDMGIKKVMALFGGIGAACLAGVLLLRKRQKKYS